MVGKKGIANREVSICFDVDKWDEIFDISNENIASETYDKEVMRGKWYPITINSGELKDACAGLIVGLVDYGSPGFFKPFVVLSMSNNILEWFAADPYLAVNGVYYS